ncbi:MAG: hypothetical protein ABI970_12045, partial [Chloroflexota bacterium]
FHLSEVMLSEMLTPYTQVGNQAGLYWGLGWGIEQATNKHNYFWHWGQRRSRTRNFAIGSRDDRSGLVILTNHENGLTLCEAIVKTVMPQATNTAFKWLLPARKWRGDGINVD